MIKPRFSIRWQRDKQDSEFAQAQSLLEAGRVCLRADSNEGRCMVVWDNHAQEYVEPEEMLKIYQKLMR